MPFCACRFERACDQSLTNAPLAKWWLDSQRAEQQCFGFADANRRKPHRADQNVPIRAVNDRSSRCVTCSRNRYAVLA